MPRIVARGLGKKYRIYRHPLARLVEWASRDRRVLHRSEWALRGVSFEVSDGESVGIIGMNGAGKSTLLRLLTGTTQPSEGTFHVAGSVAALPARSETIMNELRATRKPLVSIDTSAQRQNNTHVVPDDE